MSKEQSATNSGSPRTDALVSVHDEADPSVARSAGYNDLLDHARQLERELAVMTAKFRRERDCWEAAERGRIEALTARSSIGATPAAYEFQGIFYRKISDEFKSQARPLYYAVSATVPLSKSELVLLIDYHDNGESEADGMGVAESAAYHRKRREHYAALLATLESARADDGGQKP